MARLNASPANTNQEVRPNGNHTGGRAWSIWGFLANYADLFLGFSIGTVFMSVIFIVLGSNSCFGMMEAFSTNQACWSICLVPGIEVAPFCKYAPSRSMPASTTGTGLDPNDVGSSWSGSSRTWLCHLPLIHQVVSCGVEDIEQDMSTGGGSNEDAHLEESSETTGLAIGGSCPHQTMITIDNILSISTVTTRLAHIGRCAMHGEPTPRTHFSPEALKLLEKTSYIDDITFDKVQDARHRTMQILRSLDGFHLNVGRDLSWLRRRLQSSYGINNIESNFWTRLRNVICTSTNLLCPVTALQLRRADALRFVKIVKNELRKQQLKDEDKLALNRTLEFELEHERLERRLVSPEEAAIETAKLKRRQQGRNLMLSIMNRDLYDLSEVLSSMMEELKQDLSGEKMCLDWNTENALLWLQRITNDGQRAILYRDDCDIESALDDMNNDNRMEGMQL